MILLIQLVYFRNTHCPFKRNYVVILTPSTLRRLLINYPQSLKQLNYQNCRHLNQQKYPQIYQYIILFIIILFINNYQHQIPIQVRINTLKYSQSLSFVYYPNTSYPSHLVFTFIFAINPILYYQTIKTNTYPFYIIIQFKLMDNQKPIVPLETKFSVIQCQKAFTNLTDPQKLYAYYFSRASWEGAKICYFQRSYESPAFFYIILKTFQNESPRQFYDRTKSEFGQEILDKVFIYIANFLGNCGNYKSFGDSKFVPDVQTDTLQKVLLSSKYWKDHQNEFKEIYSDIEEMLYRFESPFGLINFGDQQGTTGYYSKNVTLKDAERVKASLQQLGILSQNNRLIKINDNSFIVRIASIKKQEKTLTSKQGIQIKLQYGQFSPFLQSLNQNLQKAGQHAANEHQKEMIKKYIEHFKDGDVKLHKQSQIHWVKDKGPSIETNIGFIQSYLDPLKVRAQFEGFVAVVNKEQSKILNKLVELAEKIISQLPWGKSFQVQEFKKPDFTSLQVLTFACSSTPVGINIPNYDEIREHHGFKNVNLGNAYGTPTKQSVQYIPESEINLQLKYHNPSLFLIVALHELLGHGTGKLYHELPVFENPLKYTFDSFYKQGETWHSVFGDIASGYQQCRADAVALYLSTFSEVRQLLLPNYSQEERIQIMHAAWLQILTGGVQGLEYYDKDTDRWMQAHIAASYAILSVLIEKGGVVELKQTTRNDKPYVQIHMNKDSILTSGKEAIGEFLKHLQVYKSTADFKRGQIFFKNYLKVDQKLLGYRDIVIKNKRPRKIEVQPDVQLVGDKVEYRGFGADVFSSIESQLFHHRSNHESVLEQWKLNSPFKY